MFGQLDQSLHQGSFLYCAVAHHDARLRTVCDFTWTGWEEQWPGWTKQWNALGCNAVRDWYIISDKRRGWTCTCHKHVDLHDKEMITQTKLILIFVPLHNHSPSFSDWIPTLKIETGFITSIPRQTVKLGNKFPIHQPTFNTENKRLKKLGPQCWVMNERKISNRFLFHFSKPLNT